MNLVKEHTFDEIRSLQLGFGQAGPPMMTVRFYLLDNVLIDTGQSNMEKAVRKYLGEKKIDFILLTHHHEWEREFREHDPVRPQGYQGR